MLWSRQLPPGTLFASNATAGIEVGAATFLSGEGFHSNFNIMMSTETTVAELLEVVTTTTPQILRTQFILHLTKILLRVDGCHHHQAT